MCSFRSMLWSSMAMTFFCDALFSTGSVFGAGYESNSHAEDMWIDKLFGSCIRLKVMKNQHYWIETIVHDIYNDSYTSRDTYTIPGVIWKKKCREKSLFKETPLYCIKRKYSKHIFQKLLKTIQNPDLSTTSPILNNRILFSSDSIKFAEGLIRYFSIRLNSMILLIWIEWRTLQHWENLQRTTNSTVYNNVLFE